MKSMNCEDFLIQKLALIDGEQTELSDEQIAEHSVNCEQCRQEIEDLQKTIILLNRQKRQTPNADLWSAIEKRIDAGAQNIAAVKWQPFVLIGACFVFYKLLEMIPERDLGWALKIVPLGLIAILFGFLKENPFKINTELILEK